MTSKPDLDPDVYDDDDLEDFEPDDDLLGEVSNG